MSFENFEKAERVAIIDAKAARELVKNSIPAEQRESDLALAMQEIAERASNGEVQTVVMLEGGFRRFGRTIAIIDQLKELGFNARLSEHGAVSACVDWM